MRIVRTHLKKLYFLLNEMSLLGEDWVSLIHAFISRLKGLQNDRQYLCKNHLLFSSAHLLQFYEDEQSNFLGNERCLGITHRLV